MNAPKIHKNKYKQVIYMAENNSHELHNRLILAGIEELNKNGLQNFSVRRIADRCGVSCAAPYKHFKDKQSYVAAIIEYINVMWAERLQGVLRRNLATTREQILETSLEYIRFLVENPYFRSILMLKDEQFDSEYERLRGQVSKRSRELIGKYCIEVNMPDKVALRKTFVVRSLIYGAALMFDNGELDYTDENMQFVSDSIDREFDLP